MNLYQCVCECHADRVIHIHTTSHNNDQQWNFDTNNYMDTTGFSPTICRYMYTLWLCFASALVLQTLWCAAKNLFRIHWCTIHVCIHDKGGAAELVPSQALGNKGLKDYNRNAHRKKMLLILLSASLALLVAIVVPALLVDSSVSLQIYIYIYIIFKIKRSCQPCWLTAYTVVPALLADSSVSLYLVKLSCQPCWLTAYIVVPALLADSSVSLYLVKLSCQPCWLTAYTVVPASLADSVYIFSIVWLSCQHCWLWASAWMGSSDVERFFQDACICIHMNAMFIFSVGSKGFSQCK